MRDLLIAAVLMVFGGWLLATNNPMDASAGQFAIAWLSIALGASFAAFHAWERLT
jgi:hypothetical protein